MSTDFKQALMLTLKYEGGYVNNPHDKGGETNKGITSKVYDNYRTKSRLPIQSVKLIKDNEVDTIYYTNYWCEASCDKIPKPLNILVFDFAVHSGPTRAVKYLQRLLNVNDDGVIGPKTLAALNLVEDLQDFCNEYLDARDDLFAGIVAHNNTQSIFLKGWLNRTISLRSII
jgi:lysozyme family protein